MSRYAAAARIGALLLLVALLPAAAARTARAAEVYEVSVAPSQLRFSPGAGATVGSYAVLWSTGAASAFVTTTSG